MSTNEKTPPKTCPHCGCAEIYISDEHSTHFKCQTFIVNKGSASGHIIQPDTCRAIELSQARTNLATLRASLAAAREAMAFAQPYVCRAMCAGICCTAPLPPHHQNCIQFTAAMEALPKV